MIYTSGSTGTPKGSQISHRSLLNLLFWHLEAFGLSARDRATHLAGLGFDAATWESAPYLLCGACVCLLDDVARLSASQVQQWLARSAITISFLPTPLAEQVVPLNWSPSTALRLLLVGGDRLHQVDTSRLPFVLINNYGPTEYTVVATSGQVLDEQDASLPAIGRPIANTQVYVLDARLLPVPQGVEGELYLAGEGLARGYMQQPALTAERFVPNPFSPQEGQRLYRTGDRVRFLPDGRLQFLGRGDSQVKVRGYRIELGEIETHLRQHEQVQETVVVLREDRPGDLRWWAILWREQEKWR